MADGDDDAPFIVADGAPMRYLAGFPGLVGYVALEVLRAGDLDPVIEIVNGMENGVVVGEVLDRAGLGNTLFMLSREGVPPP